MGKLIPYDRILVGSAQKSLRPFYRSYEDAVLWPCPIKTFAPLRTVNFTTAAGLTSAISGLLAGDLVKYTGTGVLTITGTTGNAIQIGKSLASMAWFDFGSPYGANYVKGVMNTTSAFFALYLPGCQNIGTYGGYFTAPSNTNGGGIRIANTANNVQLWDFISRDTQGGTLDVLPTTGTIRNVVIRGEVINWGLNYPALDTHNEKGTGIHGCQFSDSNFDVQDSTVALYGHDSNCGAELQWGNPVGIAESGMKFFLKSERLNFAATSQVAANTLQIWGDGNLTGAAELLIGKNQQGRVVDCEGMSAADASATIVKHGRAYKTNLNPNINSSYDRTDPYGKDPANLAKSPKFQDCLKV